MHARHALILLALLFPITLSAQSVILGEVESLEGITRTVSDVMSMDMLMTIEMGGGQNTMDLANSKVREYEEEIIEMQDGEITRRKITYSKAVDKEVAMRGPTEEKPPVTDITYIIDRSVEDGTVTWTYARDDGEELSKEEIDFLKKESEKNKKKNGFESILKGRTMTIGETVEMTEEELATFHDAVGNESNKMKQASVTLTGLREADGEQIAMFDIKATMTGNSNALEFEIVLDGSAEVLVEKVWPLSLQLEGDITGAGSHAGASITAEGIMTGKRTVAYD